MSRGRKLCLIKKCLENSGQDGGTSKQIPLTSLKYYRKNYNQNTKEIPPKIVRKIKLYGSPPNQGFIEATFTQMGKRGRDLEMCRDVQRCRMGIIPNPHGGGINWEGYLGSEKSQPPTRHQAQGSRARKMSPHQFWL